MSKPLCVSHARGLFTADCKAAALAAAHNCRVVQPTLPPFPTPCYTGWIHFMLHKPVQIDCSDSVYQKTTQGKITTWTAWAFSLKLQNDLPCPPMWCWGSHVHVQITAEENIGVGSKFLPMGSMHFQQNYLIQKLALLWTTSKSDWASSSSQSASVSTQDDTGKVRVPPYDSVKDNRWAGSTGFFVHLFEAVWGLFKS